MMNNKEKFLSLVSKEKTDTIARNKERIRNREMLRESQKIALKVLMKLDELKWTQIDLAEKMKVSKQQISKIVSGKENLTIETQIKLQNILDIPILASYYEKIYKHLEGKAFHSSSVYAHAMYQSAVANYQYGQQSPQRLKIGYEKSTHEYLHQKEVV